jgi:hypothetical protein
MNKEAATVPVEATKRRAAGLALVSAALALLAVATYPPLMEVAWIRSTGAPVWVGFALAAALAIIAIRRDRRIWVRGVAGLTLAFIALGVYAFFGLAKLPQASALTLRDRIPALTLPDENNRPVALLDAARAGPTLLVFYRGFW